MRRDRGGAAPFRPGETVVLYVREPHAKFWGVVRWLDATGVAIEGADLASFDELIRGVIRREIGPSDLSLAFFPMTRVEKILVDRGSEAAPSLSDQFRARIGVDLAGFLRPARRAPRRSGK